MAPKNLFNLILKVLGLFFIGSILESLSRTLSVLIYLPQYKTAGEAYINLAVTFPSLLLFSFVSWLLIFRTNNVVDFLKLDRYFGEETIDLRVHRSVILAIAVIFLGLWVLINSIPECIRYGVYYYQERKMYVRMARPDISYLVMSFVEILIGAGLIIFNKTIVNMIEVKRANRTAWYWPAKVPFVRRKKLRAR